MVIFTERTAFIMGLKPKKLLSVSASKKRAATVIIMCVIVLLGVINLLSEGSTKMVLKTAVISEDTALYMDPELKNEYSGQFKKGDLVSVLYNHKGDVYYILGAATEVPFLEGYISGDKFTYDFETANQGILNTNAVYKGKNDQKPAGYVVEKGRTPCIINGFEDEWTSISLPGGIDGLWVKTEDIIYDLNYDVLEAENFGYYRLVKEYMQKEYTSTYDDYYANNYVRALSAYNEEYDEETGELTCEFILNGMSKNKYKDPDSVKYIKEAKEAVAGDGDQLYYETLYREYNMYRPSNFILKLTATAENGKLDKGSIRLYSDMGVGADADWKELKKGLKDFIID